jgi:hypothetical protein
LMPDRCDYCGVKLPERPKGVQGRNRHYCDRVCKDLALRERPNALCALCHKPYRKHHKPQKFCSRECMGLSHSRKHLEVHHAR